MQITDNLKESIGVDWCRLLKDFIESDAMDEIFRELKSRKGRGILTAPDSSDLWKAFRLTDPNKIHTIIAGISPYHTFTKEGKCVADGIALSCSKTKVLQPSLDNLYAAWNREYSDSIDPDMDKNPDLSYLCESGVMLYNVALTVKKDMACSDNQLWAKFNKFFWQMINSTYSGLCIVLLGNEAHKSAQFIDPLRHYIFKLEHPAAAAYSGTAYDTKGTFRKIDKILWDNNKIKQEWYRKKNWKEDRTTWEDIKKSTVGIKSTVEKEEEFFNDLPWS